ncbi:MAG: GNAT family N-acetyltransferase, partial [Chloroflexi bacterium]|nr:GNAT family N-acetyltransferase [Chloroflexota bacterium]
ALHRKMGFVEAGLLKNVGYKFGRYLDVSFWQKSLSPR